MDGMERLKCCDCGRFISRPFDQSTSFGCADPEAPEPYDPDLYCRTCAKKLYKSLLKRYSCCYRSGDWQKSNAEIRAAKEAGLEWIDSSGIVITYSGRDIMYSYVTKWEKRDSLPYLEYHAKRRAEKRCKCWRKLNIEGNCGRCNYAEVFCLCKYDSGLF